MDLVADVAQWIAIGGLGVYCFRLLRGLKRAEGALNEHTRMIYELQQERWAAPEEDIMFPEMRSNLDIGLNATSVDVTAHDEN